MFSGRSKVHIRGQDGMKKKSVAKKLVEFFDQSNFFHKVVSPESHLSWQKSTCGITIEWSRCPAGPLLFLKSRKGKYIDM